MNFNCEDVKKLITQKERRWIDWKETAFLNNKEKLSYQLVAFANSGGGHLLIGVRDDGTLEGIRFQNYDEKVKDIANVAYDRCSPPVLFDHQLVSCPEGDVLVITIKPSRFMPSAAVEREGKEIKARIYYQRSSSGKRLVTDEQLRWMFNYSPNPNIEDRFITMFYYNRDDFSIPSLSPDVFEISIPPYKASDIYTYFLSALGKEATRYLQRQERDEIQETLKFVAEILPYVALLALSRYFGSAWPKRICDRLGYPMELLRYQSKSLMRENIPLPPSEAFISSKLHLDISSILNDVPYWGISMPRGTDVKVELKGSTSLLSFELPEKFTIQIKFIAGEWRPGLPPRHPLSGVLGHPGRALENAQWLRQIASVGILTEFKADFSFPEEDVELFALYHEWASQMKEEIKKHLDWEIYVNSLPNSKIFSIDYNVKEILKRLRKICK